MGRGSHKRTNRVEKGGGAWRRPTKKAHATRKHAPLFIHETPKLVELGVRVGLVHAGGSAWSPCGTPDVALAGRSLRIGR